MGNGSVIRPGDVQRMTAGTGVLHSEFNASKAQPVHFLQIWILPNQRGLTPSWEQKRFDPAERAGQFRVVASPDGRDGSVTVHQDVTLWSGVLKEGQSAALPIADRTTQLGAGGPRRGGGERRGARRWRRCGDLR